MIAFLLLFDMQDAITDVKRNLFTKTLVGSNDVNERQ
jgi:hypothetical protein